MALIDLSQRYISGMFSQRLFPEVKVTRCIRIEESRLNVTCLDVCVHHGTHIDAPRHFLPAGRTVADLRLEEVCGPGLGIAVERGGGEAIHAEDLERQAQSLEPGDILTIHTGWGRWFHDDPETYSHHPYLSTEAAGWIRDRRVKLVVLDVPTPDRPEGSRAPGFDWPVHHLLLEAGVLIIEHAHRLDAVAGRRFRAYAFPLPIQDSDGSPVRLVAEL